MKSDGWWPYVKSRGPTKTLEEGNVTLRSDIGVMALQAKGSLEPPAAEKIREKFPLEPSERARSCQHLNLRPEARRTMRA